MLLCQSDLQASSNLKMLFSLCALAMVRNVAVTHTPADMMMRLVQDADINMKRLHKKTDGALMTETISDTLHKMVDIIVLTGHADGTTKARRLEHAEALATWIDGMVTNNDQSNNKAVLGERKANQTEWRNAQSHLNEALGDNGKAEHCRIKAKETMSQIGGGQQHIFTALRFLDGPSVHGVIEENGGIQSKALEQIKKLLQPVIDGLVWMTTNIAKKITSFSDALTLKLPMAPVKPPTISPQRASFVVASALLPLSLAAMVLISRRLNMCGYLDGYVRSKRENPDDDVTLFVDVAVKDHANADSS